MSKKRDAKKAIKQIDNGVLTAVEAVTQALSELDVDERVHKKVVKREYPATEDEGKRTVTEEESEVVFEKGKIDVSALRTLVGVLAELRSMLGGADSNSSGIIILPSRLASAPEKEDDEQ